jgi:hypothetical protein
MKKFRESRENGFSLIFFSKKGKICQQHVNKGTIFVKYFDGIRFLRKYVEGSWGLLKIFAKTVESYDFRVIKNVERSLHK